MTDTTHSEGAVRAAHYLDSYLNLGGLNVDKLAEIIDRETKCVERESDIEELRLLLRQREWNINSQSCDECFSHKDDGHRPNCAVANGLSTPKKQEATDV